MVMMWFVWLFFYFARDVARDVATDVARAAVITFVSAVDSDGGVDIAIDVDFEFDRDSVILGCYWWCCCS